MNARLLVIPFVFICLVSAQQKPKPDVFVECDKTAKTQADLNECASRDDASADEELKRTYQELLKRVASDPIATKKIEASQKAWITFREAQIAAVYPSEDKREYGSVFPMCVNLLRAELIQQRTKMLKEMMKKPVEGDVCADGWPSL
ncbi:MAG TPA: lysozyme inhibitor LprI family protein [Candidatus Binatia bacterium]|nr:lysozyme inhibitor LprI family protein [Candidatus Binatia bacterium]